MENLFDQLRTISLLNVEGKVFFSVVARRLTSYLVKNSLIDTSVHKVGISGFSGCLEHISFIWHQIRLEKGFMAGLTFCPVAFTMAMEVLIRALKCVVTVSPQLLH